ncbi:hypothetical protein [Sporosarcina sp. E16_8]|uniref:hypothetical protein n=1 Tax=Sporosarcina sp. E16_8 TaxID=2789295 RepID=UPI001A91CEC5|nr:hypothetical protein [Sporosarcina sp. E16_8]MBO0589445.1 hypothetical protein [Sporosarcina sp. E16_8]
MKKKQFLVTLVMMVVMIGSLFSTTTSASAAYYNDPVLVKGSANYTGSSVPIDDVYLPRAHAVKFGNALAPSSVGWLTIAISFKANQYVGAGLAVSYQQASDLASKIKTYTDRGQSVRIEFIKDPVWGVDYKVHYWNNDDSYSLTHPFSIGRYQWQLYEYRVLTDVVTQVKW